jgi:hypothetical protein
MIRGGYYLSSNANATTDLRTIGARALTQYRSLADGSVFSGYDKTTKTFGWVSDLLQAGQTMLNLVVEFKHYGASAGPQTVNGKTVPAPAMRIQRKDGTGVLAYGYSQLLRGELDPLLDRFVQRLAALPNLGMVNIQLASEFDTDHEFGTTEVTPDGMAHSYDWATSDARAVEALEYVMAYIYMSVPPAVTFTIGMGGFNRDAWTRMHPAHLAPYFGLQWNAYRRSAAQTAYQVFNRTKLWTTLDLDVRWLARPVIIAEWGTPASLGNQGDWIDTVPEALAVLNAEGGPQIKVANYFNSNPGWGTLDPKDLGLQALARAYAREPFVERMPSAWYR